MVGGGLREVVPGWWVVGRRAACGLVGVGAGVAAARRVAERVSVVSGGWMVCGRLGLRGLVGGGRVLWSRAGVGGWVVGGWWLVGGRWVLGGRVGVGGGRWVGRAL